MTPAILQHIVVTLTFIVFLLLIRLVRSCWFQMVANNQCLCFITTRQPDMPEKWTYYANHLLLRRGAGSERVRQIGDHAAYVAYWAIRSRHSL